MLQGNSKFMRDNYSTYDLESAVVVMLWSLEVSDCMKLCIGENAELPYCWNQEGEPVLIEQLGEPSLKRVMGVLGTEQAKGFVMSEDGILGF